MPRVPPPSLERILARCAASTVDGCREWGGLRDRDGYGRIQHAGKEYRAHALALELATGRIQQPGERCLHSCDNPPCCEPSHLRFGTARDNAKARGRLATGERNGAARIADDDVRHLRERALVIGSDYGRWAQLAREFGTSDVTAKNIVTGKRRSK